MVIRDKTYTVDEYYALMEARDDDALIELINGELCEMPLSSYNSIINVRIGSYLLEYVDKHDVGDILGANSAYILNQDNVFLPSCSFVTKGRIEDYFSNRFYGSPDLVIETILPGETAASINEKTRLYLETGSKVVWIVYPDEQIAEIRTVSDNGFHVATVDKNGALTAQSVLPEFELPMNKLFTASTPEA